ncbi:hypothetical protein KI387_005069 [Taxus chinensis]|uniref:LOB domain-containing protein n=1 Tax=Taxus chinensis TaxID=29808 RepID=A0AA38LI93_TAXCH|nr:hypothetical protein KI387_005069 [Taxus chinensis]
MAGGGAGGRGEKAPCGACKFLRRKCAKECVFAPYFSTQELGASQFAAIHKVFGASNFSKLLQRIPSEEERYDAVLSISFEAQARLQDPIYGCVSHIFYLQQQVAYLQAELRFVEARLARSSDGKLGSETTPSSINNYYGLYASSNEQHSSNQFAPENTALFPEVKGSCLPVYKQDDCHNPFSAAKQANDFQENTNSTEGSAQHEGDLYALAFSMLRRSKN